MRIRSLAVALLAATPLVAQQRTLTTADYDKAARWLPARVAPLVAGVPVTPTWMPDGRFWYRAVRAAGTEFVLVTPSRRAKAPLFDHAAVAATLGRAAGVPIDATKLPFTTLVLSSRADSITVAVSGRGFQCDVKGTACVPASLPANGTGGAGARRGGALAVRSPDGKREAFIRAWNLWVRDVATGAETQLTTDGEPNFGYATDNAGWVHSDRAILKWSPDSRRIATQQQDDRKVGDMFLVRYKVGHPELMAWKYPLPGDSVVSMVHRVVIDVDSRAVVRLRMAPDFHRATLGDDLSMDDYQWSPDGLRLALASTSRDHKVTTVRVADAVTGAVRDVMTETVTTHFESIAGWRVLWRTDELLWNSQRDDWSQYYLYDLATGQLKRKVTTGEGPVVQLVRLDEKARTLWYLANGREPGQDPYYAHLYAISLDGKGAQRSLTPDLGTHTVQLSPDGRWIVDQASEPHVAPVTVLRDAQGRIVLELERMDISKLVAAGWKPPIPIRMKAADGKTDIHGLLFRPTDFDSTRRYPIINNAYPGPQTGSTGSRTFNAARGDRQALADLGFIVVTIDGRGTPGRSKSFHDAYYGAMGRDNTLPDQVAGMQELARRFPWIAIDRAAMWGHSGGGFITAGAMFRYPDFFKVGIAESGNHDQRNYEDDWGERYQGLLVRDGATDNYEPEANQGLAKHLKGKLLLMHGTADDNVPPDNSWLVVDALIKAGKDFDLLMIPNAAHGYGAASNYVMRRRWDYFVTHLLGAIPPPEYVIR